MNRKSTLLIRLSVAVFGVLTLAACSTSYRQIGLIESDNVKIENTNYVYTSDDLNIYYNFWSEGGQVSFCVENKTDKTITLDMTKSFFVRNGYAYDYFQNAVYGNSSSSTNSYARHYSSTYGNDQSWANGSGSFSSLNFNVSPYGNVNGTVSNSGSRYRSYEMSHAVTNGETIQTQNTQTYTQEYTEKPLIYIPAHSKKCIVKYNVINGRYIECGLAIDPTPNELLVKTFDNGEEFVKFSNNLTFVINGVEKEVVNNFRVSKVGNLTYEEAVSDRKKIVCRRTIITVVDEAFESPNAYYIDYKARNSEENSYRNAHTREYNVRNNPNNQDEFFK